MKLALEIYTKKKKKTCKFCDEYKRGAVIFKHLQFLYPVCCIKITIFFPTNFSQSLLPNEIIFVTYRNYIFPFNFRSIQTAIFLLKISSSRIIKKEIKERSSITIIHIILDRNNFSFDTIKFWKKRKKKKKKWKATQDRDANLQPYFFFFFSPFFNSRWFDRLLRRFHGMTREGGERERERRGARAHGTPHESASSGEINCP